MSEYVYAGLTSQTIDVFLRDSSSATGAGLTGLVYNSSGLKAYYRKGATGTAVQITLATQTAGGAYSSGGFVEVDATNLPGVYRLDLPNAMVDTEGFVTLHIFGATNLQPTPLRIDCRALPADVKKIAASAVNTGTAQLGVNVVTYASGQAPLQPTVAGRTLDVTATGAAGIDLGNVENPTTTLNLSGTTISTTQQVASVSGSVGSVTGSVGSINGVTFPTNFGVLGINGSGHLSRVTLVDTTTTNTDMRGTDGAALASAWTATRAGYLDSVILAANSNRTVQITGSQHIAADVHEFQPDVIDADAIAASAVTELQAGLATAANLLIVSDRVSYSLAVLVGACSDAQTAAETYTLSIGGNTFTVDYTGLDSSGNRSTTTLSKT